MNSFAPKWLRILAWVGVGIWAATITALSSLTPPQLEQIQPFALWDKAAHFLAFLVGGINLALALRWNTGWAWGQVLRLGLLLLALFAAIDETHQLFTPNRSGADPFDWLADVLGAWAGLWLTAFCHDCCRREQTSR